MQWLLWLIVVKKVIFETDCVVLLKHWDDRACDKLVIYPILVGIAKLLNLFSYVDIVFSHRKANQAAHYIAQSIRQYKSVRLLEMLRHPRF
jgi:hypothetical protein